MASFDKKVWLDANVVPHLTKDPPLQLYAAFWNGMPPAEVLVLVMAGQGTIPQPRQTDEEFQDEELADLQHREATGHPIPDKVVDEDPQTKATPPELRFDPTAWPRVVKRLLEEDDFRFDYLREQQMIQCEGGVFTAFGGDGAPLYNQEGLASVRLFRKGDDGVGLVLQVGCEYLACDGMRAGEHAAAATKQFYGQFEESPLVVCQKFGAVFGAA